MVVDSMVRSELQECLRTLADHAQVADRELTWPALSWSALARAGFLGWSISADSGGAALPYGQLLEGYEQLASACLTTCFILSQRESAIRHVKNLAQERLRRQLLEPLVDGRAFVTVGLSQLTTSRQHQRPTLMARARGDSFLFNGTIPWVTGAARAEHVVIGAVLDTNHQILAVLPTTLAGVTIGPPLDLMALRGSLTAEIQLDNVQLDRQWLLAGPAERVLGTGKGGAGGLDTSCLALGLAGAAIDHVATEALLRPDLGEAVAHLENERRLVRQQLHDLARTGGTADSTVALRTRANNLVLNATQAALTVSKGTGFLCNHPAQRWARQALFFLVWSCPRPTTQAMLASLGRRCMQP